MIENLYKKMNGTLDGLDDKIGPKVSFSRADANAFAEPTTTVIVRPEQKPLLTA